jgi:uncharacterized protein YyaL (SSP411 family)
MTDPSQIDLAVARLDAWLDTMRGPFGYGGPVCHWWRQSLLYTGPGFDWRYEGIIHGYLTLWQRTAEARWLHKARRAADDLLAAQLSNGNYPASSFEANPAPAGTPHEVAADLGLLSLALALKKLADPASEHYAQAARCNLQAYYLDKLWDSSTHSFRDHPLVPSFVPNKAATAAQAFFALSELDGDDHWAVEYALPNLDRILAHQVTTSSPLHGAIAQNSFGSHIEPKYMPFYIARCIPALCEGYEWSRQARFLDAALEAMGFVSRLVQDGGSLPAALYPHHQRNHYPQWVAALGDILRIADLLRSYGFTVDLSPLEATMLSGQDPSGGIRTAHGFAAREDGLPSGPPDLRDLLHVAGWADKTFHFLATRVTGRPLPPASCQPFHTDCSFHGLRLSLYEDHQRLQATHQGRAIYLWLKGETWARSASPEFWSP